MKRILASIWILLLMASGLQAQDMHFPERVADWPNGQEAAFNADRLQKAVQFAKDNEYSGSRNLRLAIIKGFEREPFHELLGPTKKRGGPAGMILKNGYVVASWGDTKRVDMTFSVTKSFLSTVAGLAFDRELLPDP